MIIDMNTLMIMAVNQNATVAILAQGPRPRAWLVAIVGVAPLRPIGGLGGTSRR